MGMLHLGASIVNLLRLRGIGGEVCIIMSAAGLTFDRGLGDNGGRAPCDGETADRRHGVIMDGADGMHVHVREDE